MRKKLLATLLASAFIAPSAMAQDSSSSNGSSSTSSQNGESNADITIDPADPNIQVDVPEPDVTVDQAQPDVTVSQPQPEIIVRQPAPQVTVDIPQPEIVVRMPDPNVSVDQAQPDVSVNQGEPSVSIGEGEADVSTSDNGSATVDVQRSSQANVTMQNANQQPNVSFESEDAQVTVNQERGQPNITYENSDGSPNEQMNNAQSNQGNQGNSSSSSSSQSEMTVSDIVGDTIVGSQGNDIGEIESVVQVDGDYYAVVENAGSDNSKTVAIPVSALVVGGDDTTLSANGIDQQQIEDLEPFDPSQYEEAPDDQSVTLSQQ